MVQTNNATFGYTDESEQQFAISRIRAIEHGRSVVHVSTVGVSGFIRPDGTVTEKTALFTADQRVASPVVRTERTVCRPARRRAGVGRRRRAAPARSPASTPGRPEPLGFTSHRRPSTTED